MYPVLRCRPFLALTLVSVLTGCSTPPPKPVAPSSFTVQRVKPQLKKPGPSYVVLLPSPDGTVGKVMIAGQRGQQLLDLAEQGAWLDGNATPFNLSKSTIDRDFSAALEARPRFPEHFLFYFEAGGTVLTAESKAVLKQLLERARSFPTLDISVVGHTDTRGRSDVNEVLGLNRAKFIALEIQRLGVKNMAIAVESSGERNPMVPTPDETTEQRNRRVTVTLR
jgi:outer membrane protein OmpA-like peptidoglycan-associated protein